MQKYTVRSSFSFRTGSGDRVSCGHFSTCISCRSDVHSLDEKVSVGPFLSIESQYEGNHTSSVELGVF